MRCRAKTARAAPLFWGAALACFFWLWRNATRGCAGEGKKAFAVSFERSGMVFNTIPKRCGMQREEARLREAGQVMQKTEYSAPLERLASSMPFPGLRKPQALPGA